MKCTAQDFTGVMSHILVIIHAFKDVIKQTTPGQRIQYRRKNFTRKNNYPIKRSNEKLNKTK